MIFFSQRQKRIGKESLFDVIKLHFHLMSFCSFFVFCIRIRMSHPLCGPGYRRPPISDRINREIFIFFIYLMNVIKYFRWRIPGWAGTDITLTRWSELLVLAPCFSKACSSHQSFTNNQIKHFKKIVKIVFFSTFCPMLAK